jgi:hypothetical protein
MDGKSFMALTRGVESGVGRERHRHETPGTEIVIKSFRRNKVNFWSLLRLVGRTSDITTRFIETNVFVTII